MLTKLYIKNAALIDDATIEFEKGLNVLSGETGSGKSVVLEALNFVLGAKADKSLIRSGTDECVVKAEFDLDGLDGLDGLFDELDIEKDTTLVVSRKLALNGRNSVKINGAPATATMLKKFTSLLLDVHGQSEHFSLLNESNQLDLLDGLCGKEGAELKFEVKNAYYERKKIVDELDSLGGDEQKRQIRLDVLNFQINEIEQADVKEGEEAELLEIRQKLINREKILSSLSSVNDAFSSEGGVIDVLSGADKEMSQIASFSEEYSSIYDRISSVLDEIEDISSSVAKLTDCVDDMDYDVEFTEERLDKIKSIKRKYGATVEEINEFYNNAVLERDKLIRFDELAEELLVKKSQSEKKLYVLYVKLSDLRKKQAKIFAESVVKELSELGIKSPSFSINFSDFPTIEECSFKSFNGIDQITFVFSANVGEPLKPLSSVISGGEISRFMLAVKSLTAKYNSVGTFVFDEIDAGVSGIVAGIVAEKFAKISKNVQVIAISHLPQISSMADNNILIEKIEENGKTYTKTRKLDKNEKISEVLRLIGGDKNSSTAVSHAKEMINKAELFKKTI